MNMIIRPAVAVKMARGPTITLRSGAEFDLLDPWGSSFTLSDVAHGLAHICRYAGQCSGFYSVAEHSILVSEVATGCELQALMHDAAEAFLGDVTRPLKQLLPDYKKIETDVEAAVLARFGIGPLASSAVKAADLRVLAAEQQQIMPPGTNAWAARAGVSPAPVKVRFLRPEAAYDLFLSRYAALSQQLPNKVLRADRAGEMLTPAIRKPSTFGRF